MLFFIAVGLYLYINQEFQVKIPDLLKNIPEFNIQHSAFNIDKNH